MDGWEWLSCLAGWVVGKSDFNENPAVSLDLDLDCGLRLRVCQNCEVQKSLDNDKQASLTLGTAYSVYEQLAIAHSIRPLNESSTTSELFDVKVLLNIYQDCMCMCM